MATFIELVKVEQSANGVKREQVRVASFPYFVYETDHLREVFMPYRIPHGKDTLHRSGSRRPMRVSRQEKVRQKKIILASVLFFLLSVSVLLFFISVKLDRLPENLAAKRSRGHDVNAEGEQPLNP